MEQQAYSYLHDVSMDPAPEPSMFTPMAPMINKDQELRLMIEDAKLAKNTGETMFNTTLERKRRAADMAVIDPIAQDHRERIRQQEEIANKITNVITPQMADEQAKAQAAQQQQKRLMGQLVGMQAPEQRRGQMGIADILSAGIAALFGGAQGVNQALEGGFQRAGQDAQMQFQNEGRQFEQQQQNIMLQLQQLGLDEKTAQHAFEVLQGRQFDLQDQGAKSAEAEKARELKLTLEQMKQEGKLDLKAVDFYKTVYGKMKPEVRSQAVAAALASMGKDAPPELLQAVNELNTKDELDRANTAFVEGPKTENIQARTATENALRTPRQKKIEADIERTLGGVQLDEARKDQIRQHIRYYPEEFQAKMANIQSQIVARSQAAGGKPVEYWGKGMEARFQTMSKIAQQSIAILGAKNAGAIMMGGEWSSPADKAAYDAALADYHTAQDALQRIGKEKAATARVYAGGGNSGPDKQIDVSGGFTDSGVAPFKPEVPGVTDNPFTGAKASAGGARKATPAKKDPHAQLRQEAKAAIDAGADAAKVRARFKSKTGKDL